MVIAEVPELVTMWRAKGGEEMGLARTQADKRLEAVIIGGRSLLPAGTETARLRQQIHDISCGVRMVLLLDALGGIVSYKTARRDS